MAGAFTPAGTPVPQRIVFNSGQIDFGNSRLVDLDNIALKLEYTVNDLFVLNSIKPVDNPRSTQKVTLTGKVKTFSPELYMYSMGSSTIGTPQEIDTLDGQPTLQNPVVTVFDRNGKQAQWQLINAVFKSINMAAKMEDFAEFDFELDARDIQALVYTQ